MNPCTTCYHFTRAKQQDGYADLHKLAGYCNLKFPGHNFKQRDIPAADVEDGCDFHKECPF